MILLPKVSVVPWACDTECCKCSCNGFLVCLCFLSQIRELCRCTVMVEIELQAQMHEPSMNHESVEGIKQGEHVFLTNAAALHNDADTCHGSGTVCMTRCMPFCC